MCPTHYQTWHFFNNFTTNEDIATKFEADLPTTDTYLFISHTTSVLLFKFRCNILIGVRIIKEMLGSVVSGTPYITPWRRILQKLISPHLIKKLATLVHDDSLPRSKTPHYSET